MINRPTQARYLENLEKSMHKIARTLRAVGEEMRHQGDDRRISALLIQTANDIESELPSP